MTLLEFALGIYILISLCTAIFAAVGEFPAYYIVLWPVVLAKYLLRSLYFELFTGWKEKP